MAAATRYGDLSLGNFLKIMSHGAVYNNLSEDSPLWDYIKKKKKGEAEGRQANFLLRTRYGAPSVGFLPTEAGDYPTAVSGTQVEGTTYFKDFGLSVSVPRTLLMKAKGDMSKYGAPLAEELRAKTIAMSRQLSRSLYQDGTGVIGTVAAVSAVSGGEFTITLASGDTDRGYIGWFEEGDYITAKQSDGTAQVPTGATYMVVESIDRDNNQITVSGGDGTITAVNQIGAADLLYRKIITDNNFIAISSITTGTTDLNSVSSMWVGLEGLAANDGTLANGITLTGKVGGTQRDVGGNALDSQDFQRMLSKLMVQAGVHRYKYNKAMMGYDAYDSLIESRETDRRFNTVTDNKRGTNSLAYVHKKNTVEFEPDEFCRDDRIWLVPEGDVLQYRGSDFEFVRAEGGPKFHLANASSGTGHSRSTNAYMEGNGALMSVHSGAIGLIRNFDASA